MGGQQPRAMYGLRIYVLNQSLVLEVVEVLGR